VTKSRIKTKNIGVKVHITCNGREKACSRSNGSGDCPRQDWKVKTLPIWQPGETILRVYEIERSFEGGMGLVYIANHKEWKVKLAIKAPNQMMLSNKPISAEFSEKPIHGGIGSASNIAYCYYVREIEGCLIL